MNRIRNYALGWLALTATVFAIRFIWFADTNTDRRFNLGIAYLLVQSLFFGLAGLYEERRMVVGRDGGSGLTWFRGWAKTTLGAHVRTSMRPELVAFRRLQAFAFPGAMVVVILLVW